MKTKRNVGHSLIFWVVFLSIGLEMSLWGSPSDFSQFGQAYNAGYYDTSSFLAGKVAVGIFYSGDPWNGSDMDLVYSEVEEAINDLIVQEKNAHLEFTFVKEVDASGTPNALPLDYWDYVNTLRNTYQTHWAFAINIISENLYYKYVDVSSQDATVRIQLSFPETGIQEGGKHSLQVAILSLFGAGDYGYSQNDPKALHGYLNFVHGNSPESQHADYSPNTWGFFEGHGERLPDIMYGRGPIGLYTRGQIGWMDSDGDGILDILDTYSDTMELLQSESNPYSFTGVARDVPIRNEKAGRGDPPIFKLDVTLNTIQKVEYRINQNAWMDAEASDGIFDWGEEAFQFTVPELPNGTYTIEVRSINSVGNKESSYASHILEVENSTVNNLSPFPSFSYSPALISTDSTVLLDASSSSDLEESKDDLTVRWDFENDGYWDTSYSEQKTMTHVFLAPGIQTIGMEVTDSEGGISSLVKEIMVNESNLAPIAQFTVNPSESHGVDNMIVRLDAQSSFDSEDNPYDLQLRWDFEDDGIWDTSYSSARELEYQLKIPLKFQMEAQLELPKYANQFFFQDNHVFVANGHNGLQIIDNSDSSNPFIKGSAYTPTYAKGVFVQNQYVYLVGYEFGLRIYDVSNLYAPTLVGFLDLGNLDRIFVQEGKAYITSQSNKSLHIVDVTQPSMPNQLGVYTFPTFSSSYSGSVLVDQSYAYVVNGTGLSIIDITDSSNPTLTGQVSTSGNANDMCRTGSYFFIADGDQITIIDASDVANPLVVHEFGEKHANHNYTRLHLLGNTLCAVAFHNRVEVYDVSEIFNPKKTNFYSGPVTDIYNNMDHMYLLYGNSQSDPAFLSSFTSLSVGTAIKDMSMSQKIRLEVKDSSGKKDQATRDVWTVSYNQPPDLTLLLREGKQINQVDEISHSSWSHLFYDEGLLYSWEYTEGLKIYDASDPNHLTQVGAYPLENAYIWDKIKVVGGRLYALEDSKRLSILDVTDPANIQWLGAYDYAPNHYFGWDVVGFHAFLFSSTSIDIVDVTDPADPVYLSRINTSDFVEDIAFYQNFIYVAHKDAIEVFNIADLLNVELISAFSIGIGLNEIIIEDQLLFAQDNYQGLFILDISNPASPYEMSRYNLSTFPDIFVQAPYVFVRDPYNSVKVIDVSDPYSPVMVAMKQGEDYLVDVIGGVNFIFILTDNAIKSYTWNQSTQFIEAVGSDPNFWDSWDNFLQYRWDFNNDQTWDTPFRGTANIFFPSLEPGTSIGCQVRDRFYATRTEIFNVPLNQIPEISSMPVTDIEAGGEYRYNVVASDADGDSLRYGLTNAPLGMNINSATGLITWAPQSGAVGDHSITVLVSDGQGGEVFQIYTLTVSATLEQNPWNGNESGILFLNRNYNYTMGYRFVPQKDGFIRSLGGFFNGAKTITVWDDVTGSILAQADVTSNNNWQYISITPVAVTNGRSYTVATYLAGNGGAYRNGINVLPATFGDIQITSSVFSRGNTYPTTEKTTLMYGQVDIGFVVGGAVNQDPVITTGPIATPAMIQNNETATLSVIASDPEGDPLTYTWSATQGTFSGSGSTVVFGPSPVSSQTIVTVQVTVDDGKGGGASGQTTLTVNPDGGVTEETPWQRNTSGTLSTGYIWKFTLGYHFSPQIDGAVTQLGALVNGTKKVSLWNRDTGDLLASVDVAANDTWAYAPINPVNITAGGNYTVAVNINGSGGSAQRNINAFPQQFGNIEILSSCYAAGNVRPVNQIFNTMFGQADIAFLPQGSGSNLPPDITSALTANPTTIEDSQTSTLRVTASDPDSDPLTYTWSTSLGSFLGSGATVTYVPSSVTQPTLVDVTVVIDDGRGGSVADTLQINVLPVISGTIQKPWSENESGVLLNNRNYDYTMGYRFTPQENGSIQTLGGYFNGTRTIMLWDDATNTVLAQADVTSSYNWQYASITPVSVITGRSYTVATYLGGSGGSFRNGIGALPATFGDIQITSSVFSRGNAYPTTERTTSMYGQVDVGFLAS